MSRTKVELVAEAMASYERAQAVKGSSDPYKKVFRRWLDDVYTYRDGMRRPIRDDNSNVLHTWGPPLAWFDQITRQGRDGGMAADLDFFLERNGLYLVIEFKSARGERRKAAGSNHLSVGQWRSLAALAKSGLFVVYVVEYQEPGGNDVPPVVSRIRRLTDDVAPARRWQSADFGDLLVKVHEWCSNASNPEFVRRQRAAAVFMQFLQLQLGIAPYSPVDNAQALAHRRLQHEAMRLAARSVRDGDTPPDYVAFRKAFEQKLAEKSSGQSDESSTA